MFVDSMKNTKVHKLNVTAMKVLFAGFFLFLHLNAVSQEILWSNPRKLKGFAVYTQIAGENEEGLFLIRYKSRLFQRNIILEKYRKELGYVYSKNLLMGRSQLDYACTNENGIVLFRSEYDKQQKIRTVKAQLYHSSLQQNGSDKILFRHELAHSEQLPCLFYRDKIQGNILIFSRLPGERSESSILEFRMYSPQLEEIYMRRVILDKPLKEIMPSELLSADSVGIALLFRHLVRQTKKNVARSQTIFKNHEYVLILPKDTTGYHLYQLGDSTFHFTQPEMNYDRTSGKLFIQQVFGTSELSGQQGIYELLLDKNYDTTERYYYFDSVLVESLNPQRTLEGRTYLSDYKIIRVIPQSNGGSLSIIERASMASEEEVIFISGIAQNASRNIYNFEDVALISRDSSGKMLWNQVINKSQSTINDGGYFSSVIPVITPAAVHILFNDMLLNVGTVLQYTIWSDGSLQSKILLGNDREYVNAIPSEAMQISATEWILPVLRDRKFALVKLQYPL